MTTWPSGGDGRARAILGRVPVHRTIQAFQPPTVEELVRAATQPGRQVIFIDDSGTLGGSLPPHILVPDFRLLAGIVVPSDALNRLEDGHDRWLSAARQTCGKRVGEIHGTELVNPGNRSPWYGVEITARADLLRSGFDLVLDCTTEILFAYIGDEQFRGLIDAARARAPSALTANLWEDPKAGLERVFYRALADRLIADGTHTLVVQDADERRVRRFQHLFDESVPVCFGGVAYLPSHLVAGLQLADVVAYALNRVYHLRGRAEAGKARCPLDMVVAEFISKSTPRRAHLLD